MTRTLQSGLELSAQEKRALLADLLREKAARGKVVPISFAQQRLWFLSRLEPDSPAYNIPRPLRLLGALDVDVLRRTFNAILARHEVLRGRFDLVEGGPVQLIEPRLEIELPLTDLQQLSDAEREAEVSRRAVAEARQPFDLSHAPLLRVGLLKLAPDQHVLLLTMHHIISDGWSMGILVREMSTIYRSLLLQQPVELPPLQIQYADFARWQRQWLQGNVLEEQLGYWCKHLKGAPAVLDLPIARPRPVTQTIAGDHVVKQLDRKLTAAVRDLGRSEGVTMFMTLLAAFKTLLYRYSGQDDLVVGSPIAGRNRAELEPLIGFFVNTLPLRTTLAGNPTFRELMRRVKETALQGFAHQDVPFEKIVEEVHPPRSLSYTPVFQVMFALQNQPPANFNLPGLNITHVNREYDTSKFDFSLYVTERDESLGCWLEYNTDLFTADVAEGLLDHFEILLRSIVAEPNQRIANLRLINEDEENRLLFEWNDSRASFPSGLLHELFEKQAERSPDAVALICGSQRVTYRELNLRASQLAHFLIKSGVGPESRVAICLPRTAEMVVSVLAVLKAGGAYVPLDPAYPSARLAFTLEDSNASLLITNRNMATTLPVTKALRILVDEDAVNISEEPSTNVAVSALPNNLAYVIYTSGSTGQPKGVAIEHRGAVQFISWALTLFSPEELQGTLLSTSLCFDISVLELFGPLASGGKVILIDNALQLPNLQSGEATLLQTVPSAITELVRIDGIPASVKTICLGGEPLVKSLVDQIYARSKVERVLNLYGPTEDTVYSTFAAAPKGNPHEPTIGRPIANNVAYILDDQLQPVPIGVPGQLHVAGEGTARGYLNRPALTAEKFIPNPFANSPGARMYRTGDLTRYLPNGEIEFLGRIDHQIKLRGYRIELGEIEAALRDHPAVQQAVVVVHEFANANRDLVAYIAVGDKTEDHDLIGDLRLHLRARLPDYMVPAYFHALAQLPLNATGKIDRRALPAPDRSGASASSSRSAPANETEERLVQIWKEVLGLETVGVMDNFFDIGGHSLLAVRLFAEIEKAFARKLPLVSLFQNSTIEGLASVLRSAVKQDSWPTLVVIQKGHGTIPLFCVSVPNVNALGYAALARHLGADQTVYGLQAHYAEDLQGEHSQFAVEELATEYLKAVLDIQPHGPYQFIGMCRGAHIGFEMARRLRARGEEVAFVGILDTWVLENTYNKFLYVEYYARRIRAALRLGFKEQFALLKEKMAPAAVADHAPQTNGAKPLANPMRAYFPGPDFQPKTYDGRVSVFRMRVQPLNRIRDKGLGWGMLAKGGVDLHYVPGKHGGSLLRDPHVQVLAREMKECLVNR